MLQTEFPFTLPRGYVDAEGDVHREGVMRLATANDEVAPLKDPRVQANPGYLVIILLSRVVTRLGSLDDVNPRVIEGLFTADPGSDPGATLTQRVERIDSTIESYASGPAAGGRGGMVSKLS